MILLQVLYGWKLWVTEQCRKREQIARAAQVYRDQLLREGVTCILTYAAHMNDLTTSLTLHSQEQVSVFHMMFFRHQIWGSFHHFCLQRSQRLSRVVKRCAMRWKQRALCKPQREQEVRAPQMKKSVTFCSTAPTPSRFPSSDSEGQEAEDEVVSKLWVCSSVCQAVKLCLAHKPTPWVSYFLQASDQSASTSATPFRRSLRVSTQNDVTGRVKKFLINLHHIMVNVSYGHLQTCVSFLYREQNQSITEATPKGFDSCGPSQRNNPTALSCLHPFKPSSHITSAMSPSALRHVSTVDSPQDLLLPPSAFMTTGTQNPVIIIVLFINDVAYHDSGDIRSFFFSKMEETSRSGHQLSTLPNCVTSSGGADVCHVAADPVSALTSELMSIQLEMNNFQQARKQLRYQWRQIIFFCLFQHFVYRPYWCVMRLFVHLGRGESWKTF